MINDFLQNISSRLRNENALSDITWSMCQTSENFKKLFLNFFFPEVVFDNITRFERESSEGDSRPDFLIKNRDQIYLIECKIGDRNHHFEQYCTTFNIPSTQLGYITNYVLWKESFKTKTWHEFYDMLNENIPENISAEKELFTAYLGYLRNVCSIVKITRKMKIEQVYSLYSFTEILKSSLNRSIDNYTLEIYKQDLQTEWSGFYFKVSVQSKVEIKDIWIWAGIYYNREKPLICIAIDNKENWGKPFFDILETPKLKSDQLIYAKEPSPGNNQYFVYTNDNFNTMFDNASNAKEQQHILEEYIDEVIRLYI
ncbi:hypothetical protein CLV62_11715 [Dysgonomonas alginatilytica]|uniref:PD-(D/E)XK nuclease superfamily protein n=1 Tax=Dysgonomonas alginatilytica TaxID=1605892 RepID=A0A2V3PNP6_9BACT|nr:hypothetical protein [Dysgonomonas alginatilytica]PXV62799.1 hypothetical protein CLV62_11715 [Dysgonomonas alginatilytica]